MPLPHFTQLYMTGSPGGPGTRPQEPVYTNLFEITFLLPVILQAQGRDPVLLLQQATSAPINSTQLTRNLANTKQRFKYSTREFLQTPQDTSGTIAIPFNVNVNEQLNMETFTTLKAWYDLAWNSQNGSLHYKADLIGTIIVNQHDKKGFVLRRVTYQNCQLQNLTWSDLNWEQPGIIQSISATFVWDYFIDEYIDGGFTIQPPQVYVS
jgi:hypothetical protein